MSAERKIGQRLEPVVLTAQELDDRMDAVMQRIAAETVDDLTAQADWKPRWIRASDLVRRVRPFLVYN